jgi:hypothetical protein
MRRAACEARIAAHSLSHQAANMANIAPAEGSRSLTRRAISLIGCLYPFGTSFEA